MKIKHGIILLAIGIILLLFGSLFKVQHWPGASLLLTTGICLKVAGVLIIVIKMLKNPSCKSFLNS